MKRKVILVAAIGTTLLMTGCTTVNSTPYKASIANVVTIQQTLKDNHQVSVGDVAVAPGVDESPNCRLNGPLKVAPGKTMSQYIKDAMQEELFMAKVYNPSAPAIINAELESISFSSMAPASWDITMKISSNVSKGYTVSVSYPFSTSWSAAAACHNVADAFGPAVSELLKQVVSNPQFAALASK